MRNALVAAVLFVASLGTPSAQATLVGSWKAEFVGPMGPRPQMVHDVLFSFRETPTGLVGTAKTEPEWPGVLGVSDITINGDRFSFVGTGSSGWSTNGESHCCPRLTFAGTVNADTMTLILTWTSTEQPNDPNARAVPMEGEAVAIQQPEVAHYVAKERVCERPFSV